MWGNFVVESMILIVWCDSPGEGSQISDGNVPFLFHDKNRFASSTGNFSSVN